MLKLHASSLSDLFDCPARFKARQIDKIYMPTSGSAYLGTSIHEGTATFDQARLDGNPISIDDAVGVCVDKLFAKDEEIDWGESSAEDAEPIASALVKLYCKEIAPKMEYVAIEARCQNLEIKDLDIVLVGTIDRVYREDGSLGIADIKTGKTIVGTDGTIKTKSYGIQMGVYEILAEHSLNQEIVAPAKIIGLQAAKTAKGQRAAIGEIEFAKETLLGDEGQKGYLEIAANIIKSGIFYGNPRSALCSEKFCPIFNDCPWLA